MNFDEYDEVINGVDTFQGIADRLKAGDSVIIGWSDGQGTHFDILFVWRPISQSGLLQGGMKGGTDLFVSIMRKGAFGFIVSDQDTHPGYFAEKLFVSGEQTIEKLAELINGIKRKLCYL